MFWYHFFNCDTVIVMMPLVFIVLLIVMSPKITPIFSSLSSLQGPLCLGMQSELEVDEWLEVGSNKLVDDKNDDDNDNSKHPHRH